MSIGATKSTAPQRSRNKTNLPLCLEKKKNANPTIPYSFTNVPNIIQKAAHPSFSFSIQVYVATIIAAVAILNCCINKAVSNSWAQNQYIKIRIRLSTGILRTARYRPAESNTNQNNIPNQSGNTANGAITKLNSGP